MVESRQLDELNDADMLPDEGYDPYLQDTDILDRPDLFYSEGYDPSMVMDGHLTPEYIDENGMHGTAIPQESLSETLYGSEYVNEYEPYARPESHMGFVKNGYLSDEYGQPTDEYGNPTDEYGHPIDEYGRPIMLDEYDQYPPSYGYPGPQDEYEYGYQHGMR